MPRPLATGSEDARASRAGFTLVEIAVAAAITTVILLAAFALMDRESQLSRSTLGISIAETRAQQMLHGLEREISDARGANPKCTITAALGDLDTTQIQVDSTLGFPDQGLVVIARGTSGLERVSYSSLGPAHSSFLGLVRGLE